MHGGIILCNKQNTLCLRPIGLAYLVQILGLRKLQGNICCLLVSTSTLPKEIPLSWSLESGYLSWSLVEDTHLCCCKSVNYVSQVWCIFLVVCADDSSTCKLYVQMNLVHV